MSDVLRVDTDTTPNVTITEVESLRGALCETTQRLEQALALLALNLKVDGWNPPLVNWLKTPEEAMCAMTLNMAKSRDELKHQNRVLLRERDEARVLLRDVLSVWAVDIDGEPANRVQDAVAAFLARTEDPR